VRPTWSRTPSLWLDLMHILLLGSGGREHALAWKIAASPLVTKLWCAPGNAGIAREAECVALDIADHAAVIDFCRTNAVDLVVVGPETPLAAGIVDDLAGSGIKAFGPSRRASQLEGSKGFTKALCTEFNIPTGAYGRFTKAADALARDEGLVLVHPYDDPTVIAGQGTIALELLADQPDLDTIVVPIGGGGLISGIAVAAKALNPDMDIVGVQSTLYPSMYRLMRGEDPGPPAAAATLAEGIAVKEPGRLTRRIVKALVSDILLVDDVTIEGAIEVLLERQKLVVEGAGAAGLAAVLAAPER